MEGAQQPDGQPVTYLIVLRHILVAQDIAMTVSEFDPTARVVTVTSPAEAEERLKDIDAIALAFVGQGPDAYASSSLSWAVARRGGRVILLGEEAEAQGEAHGFAVLSRPFTTANILSHLAGS